MNSADLETPLNQETVFPVEAPDGRKDLSEHERQSWFVAFMRRTQPHIEVHANMNQGFAQGVENAAMRTCSMEEWLTLAAPRIEQDELADPDNWGAR